MKTTVHFARRSLTKVFTNLHQFLIHKTALAIGLTFAADSLMFGSWVTHIPHVKTALAMNDAQLGLALFGMPLGLLVMNPVSPVLLHRVGLVRTTVLSTLTMALSFALPVWMPDRWALMAALFLVGISIAVLNVAMNTCATHVEKEEGIYIMSSCHGMWSLGGMVGSGSSAALIALGVDPRAHLTLLALLLIGVAWYWLRPALAAVPELGQDDNGGSKFVWPTRDLLLMIGIGLSVSLGEGVAFDWSAVYLRDTLGASAQIAALGFTCFSLTMMAMRFTGDLLIPRFGERRLLLFSAGLTVLALLVIIFSLAPAMGILGFLLLGAGVALGAPILFNAAARVPGLASGAGLATYATFSFVGFLAGPPAIGFVGEAYGFSVAFGAVALLAVLSVWAIVKVRL